MMQLAERNVAVLLLYTGTMHVTDRHRDQLGPFADEPFMQQFEYEFIREIDHSLTSMASQQIFMRGGVRLGAARDAWRHGGGAFRSGGSRRRACGRSARCNGLAARPGALNAVLQPAAPAPACASFSPGSSCIGPLPL